jgi:TatD DNase family protein
MLIDTHCHIHEPYDLPVDETLTKAHQAGVDQLICVGTSEDSSEQAVAFSKANPGVFAAVGVHPHETDRGYSRLGKLLDENPDIVAIGEVGLDYFYSHSPKEVQLEALAVQIELALTHNKPIIFHVRDAFDDFWPIFDAHPGIRGVLHSFTDNRENLEEALKRGLYIGLNGISTFTKDEAQKEMFDSIPLDRILFETDAPFLTPVPHRGKVNEPAYVRIVAEYHAARRGISLEEIAKISTQNARALFSLPTQS